MKQQPRINVKPEDVDGTYSNLVLVAFSMGMSLYE